MGKEWRKGKNGIFLPRRLRNPCFTAILLTIILTTALTLTQGLSYPVAHAQFQLQPQSQPQHQAQSPARSSDDITVLENGATHSFAQRITFTLHVASDNNITEIYLFLRAKDNKEAQTIPLNITDAQRELKTEYKYNLRLNPLPPFATINYWWQIEDADGDKLITEPEQFTYSDNRFKWEDQTADGITVHWIEGRGDPAFVQMALDVSRNSVTDINAELKAPIPDPFDIYIYDTARSLEAAMLLAGRNWVSGQAHPEIGAILVSIPLEAGYTSRMKRYLPHEITHLLLYQAVTPTGYEYVPEWLDEGLATINEQLPTPEYTVALERAREEGELIPLKELCVPFSPNAQTATLAYAQSGSVVKFIRERYGAQGIRKLLAAYANGASCTSGVEEAFNISFNGLEMAWRASMEPQAPWRAWVSQIGVWIGLWLLTLLIAVPMIGGLQRVD